MGHIMSWALLHLMLFFLCHSLGNIWRHLYVQWAICPVLSYFQTPQTKLVCRGSNNLHGSSSFEKNKNMALSFGTMCFASFLAISVIVHPSNDLFREQHWPKENQHLWDAVEFVSQWSAWLCCQQAYSDQHSESNNLAALPWQCVPCSTILWTCSRRLARSYASAGKYITKKQWFKLLWLVSEVCVVSLQLSPEPPNSTDDPD